MIRYRLTCTNDHTFDAWFPNSAAYDHQQTAHLIECPICESTKVCKAPMAPNVLRQRDKASPLLQNLPTPDAPSPGSDAEHQPAYVSIRRGSHSGSSKKSPGPHTSQGSRSPWYHDGGFRGDHDHQESAGVLKLYETTDPLKAEAPYTTALDQKGMSLVEKRQAVKMLAQIVKQNFLDVGHRFSEEARRMHYGETKKRNISGKASQDEIVELLQEGIDVIPLPPFPKEDA